MLIAIKLSNLKRNLLTFLEPVQTIRGILGAKLTGRNKSFNRVAQVNHDTTVEHLDNCAKACTRRRGSSARIYR